MSGAQRSKVRLGDICDIQLGKMLSPKSKTGLRPLPYLRNANVQWGRFELSDIATMDFSEAEQRKFALRRGDLLVCEGGEPGRAAVWEGQVEPCYYQKALHRLRPVNDEVDPYFLMFRLQLAALTSEFEESHAQTTIAHLPLVRLEELRLHLPTRPEQQRIVISLREAFATVASARAAAEKRMIAARALVDAYIEGDLSSFAQHHSKRPLGELCSIVADQVDPRLPEFGSLPHVNGENIESGLCRIKKTNRVGESNLISGKYLFEPGDVLYSKIRPYLRKAAVAGFRGLCSADIYPIRVNRDVLLPGYLALVLLSREFTRYADTESRRARMPKLNRDQLFSWRSPTPPVSEQDAIATRIQRNVAATLGLIASAEAEIASINALPAALLRRAFAPTTGSAHSREPA